MPTLVNQHWHVAEGFQATAVLARVKSELKEQKSFPLAVSSMRAFFVRLTATALGKPGAIQTPASGCSDVLAKPLKGTPCAGALGFAVSAAWHLHCSTCIRISWPPCPCTACALPLAVKAATWSVV